MSDILIVVDLQYDFIDGVFGTKEAQEVAPKIMEFVKSFKGDIVATQDTHYNIEQYETNHLPLHCLEGTRGNELYEDLNKYLTLCYSAQWNAMINFIRKHI